MACARMPDAFFAESESLLPPEEPMGPEGGTLWIPHRAVIKVLWYLPVTGCRWEDVPLQLGCSGCTAQPQGGIGTHAVWIRISKAGPEGL
jgi:hypothetical protein